MGEAKRRSSQGLPPKVIKSERTKPVDTSPRVAPWLPLTRNQADRFVAISTNGAWVGIAALVVFWLTVRFIGPAAGWWSLADG
ncbi:MAG: DUF2839 domain-containing protein [Cyanobium sp.]